jgi:hypothetical protein
MRKLWPLGEDRVSTRVTACERVLIRGKEGGVSQVVRCDEQRTEH